MSGPKGMDDQPRKVQAEVPAPSGYERAVRYVTFHHRAVKEGDGVYLQPNESIVDVEYDAQRRTHYIQIMCPIDLPFDGGDPAHIDGSIHGEE